MGRWLEATQHGKISNRYVIVAVNSKPRQIGLLHMTYAQKSITCSGGYFPEDVYDVIQTAGDPGRTFSVIIRM